MSTYSDKPITSKHKKKLALGDWWKMNEKQIYNSRALKQIVEVTRLKAKQLGFSWLFWRKNKQRYPLRYKYFRFELVRRSSIHVDKFCDYLVWYRLIFVSFRPKQCITFHAYSGRHDVFSTLVKVEVTHAHHCKQVTHLGEYLRMLMLSFYCIVFLFVNNKITF